MKQKCYLFLFITILLLWKAKSLQTKKTSSISKSFWKGYVRYFKYIAGNNNPTNFITNPLSDPSCLNCFYLTVTKQGLYFTTTHNSNNRLLHNVLKINQISTKSENSNISPITNIGKYNEGYCITILESKLGSINNKSIKWGICLNDETNKNSLLNILNNILLTHQSENGSFNQAQNSNFTKPIFEEEIDPCNTKQMTVIYKGMLAKLVLTRNTISLQDKEYNEYFSFELKKSIITKGKKQCCFTISIIHGKVFSVCGINGYNLNCDEYYDNIENEFLYYKTQCDPYAHDILGDMGLPYKEVQLRENAIKDKLLKLNN